jgi:hypothetical protein
LVIRYLDDVLFVHLLYVPGRQTAIDTEMTLKLAGWTAIEGGHGNRSLLLA